MKVKLGHMTSFYGEDDEQTDSKAAYLSTFCMRASQSYLKNSVITLQCDSLKVGPKLIIIHHAIMYQRK